MSKKTLGQTLTEAIEEVLNSFYHHQVEQQQKGDILNILNHTKEIWQHGDGLQYQQKLRSEWNNEKLNGALHR